MYACNEYPNINMVEQNYDNEPLQSAVMNNKTINLRLFKVNQKPFC